ncbi:lac repressor [Chimaeribacter arupi]|uniref:Substrate-binding domain-containing protein n=1 Tax=Nissabacter archeti TaxID=1917880 RepID=A0ABS5JN50_9GAMM|nr:MULTISPECIES: LacI family DNA-binding transcriptional regulator [Yersiniaceae]MBS0971411.1 substrate-binding domain-containing protein [Nissabacter archeti]PLR32503.1 lac repressor [Chimaeribacter arupi]PLR43291.1 lac repressor [Chimaeribacter arupi]PLR50742.1 lac repressor [Chimaeribacter arupi]
MKSSAVTLDDVARQAGVSYQTVSRVINQAPHVSAKTRQRVEAAMAALNYVPNRVAQQLAGKRTQVLGLATSSLALHAPSQIAAAIEQRAGEAGYSLVMAMVRGSGPDACRQALQELRAQRVDGVLINAPLGSRDATALADAAGAWPLLFLDTDPAGTVPSVLFDPAEGARCGVSHLLQHGHRQIALLAGEAHSISAQLRLRGWRETLAAAGLEPVAVAHGDWSAAEGYRQTQRLLAAGTPFTAMLVANDQMALGVLRALHEAGRQIPQQVSVVGYDDTADSAFFYPPLTTVRQDFRLLGTQAVETLLAGMEGGMRSQVLPVTLVTRGTTGRCR